MLRSTFSLNHFSLRNFLIWCLLAFQAGAINAGGFLACHRFVSHITGFATHTGAELARGHFTQAWGMLTVPIFFLIGAMISAYFVDRRAQLHLRPRYNQLMFLISALLITATGLGLLGVFGEFGTPLDLESHYYLIALLCLACGIQNASVTSASGAVIRTTHLTGITTDLGVGLIRAFATGLRDEAQRHEIRKNRIRMGLFSSFALGSVVGSILFFNVGYYGFLLPALLAAGLPLFGAFRETAEVATPERTSA